MDQAELLRSVRKVFRGEVAEYAEAMNRAFLALEKEPQEDDRAEIFRSLLHTAHNLKGASVAAGAPLIEDTCHRLESVLARFRDGQLDADAELFQLFFQTVDALEDASRRLVEEEDLGEGALAEILESLAARLTAKKKAATKTRKAAKRPGAKARKPAKAKKPTAKAQRPVAKATPSATQENKPPEEPGPSPATTPASEASTVRIAAEKLDTLLGRSGELLVVERRLLDWQEKVRDLQQLAEDCQADFAGIERPLAKLLTAGNGHGGQAAAALAGTAENLRRLDKGLNHLAETSAADERALRHSAVQLDDTVRGVRMVPFSNACRGLERTVRDLATADDKEIVVEVRGGDVELDRSLLERLRDPLLHLVRNAIDHGVEPPAERRAAGKAPAARITVAADLRGSQVEIVVADDGRGLDTEAIRRQARKKGLVEPPDDQELVRLIFKAGFSTARLITKVSGRGVGLDVVREEIEALHGRIDVSFEATQGTSFRLTVPLTLTTIRALLVRTAGQIFAFAGTNVRQLLRVGAEDLRSVEGREMVLWGGAPLPLVSLSDTLGCGAGFSPPRSPQGDGNSPPRSPQGDGRTLLGQGKVPVVIVAAGAQQMAFVVDELLAEQEILVKNLGSRLRRLRDIAGATLLPSGRLALILNAAGVIRSAIRLASTTALGAAFEDMSAKTKKRLLVVDDSITTRTFQKSTLEAAGYEVTAVVDGVAAWQLLQDRGADPIISDVEMPRMDGFTLTETIRRSGRFAKIPVILLTARESDLDKARGLEVGANSYLLKSSFEQHHLLKTIAQLL